MEHLCTDTARVDGIWRTHTLPIVRLHAAVTAVWMLLLILQTSLIASRRTALHRRLGVLGAALACALVVLGWIVAFDLRPALSARAVGLVPPPGTVEFLILPAEELLVFSILIGWGFYARKKPGVHKRLMVLGTLVLIPAATTRPPLPGSALMALGMFGVPEALFILALMIHDVRTTGRLHSATIWGGGFVLVGAASRCWMSHRPVALGRARHTIGLTRRCSRPLRSAAAERQVVSQTETTDDDTGPIRIAARGGPR